MYKRYKYKRPVPRNYKDPRYVMWRKCVYKRDGYKCVWPGCQYKSSLNAHHIRTWAAFPTMRFDVNNGVTLCLKHHSIVKGNEDEYVLFFTQILLNKLSHKHV